MLPVARAPRRRPAPAAPKVVGFGGDVLFAIGLFLLFLGGFFTLLWRAVRWLSPRFWMAIVWLVRGGYSLCRALIAALSAERATSTAKERKTSGRSRSAGIPTRRTAADRVAPARSGRAESPARSDLLRFGLTAAAILLIATVAVLVTQPQDTAVASASSPRAATSTAAPSVAPARAPARTTVGSPTAVLPTRTVAPASRSVAAPAASPPASSCPSLPANSARLGAVVDAEISRHAGHYGVAILNLGANEAFLLNAEERFPAGSVYKLTILYEAWRRVQAGTLSPDTKITIAPADALEPEPRGGVAIGTEVSIREAIRAMITVSSNNAAHALLRTLGRDAVNRSTRDLGLRDTILPTPVRPTGMEGEDGGDVAVSSPRDALCFMNLLARDRLLAPAQNVEMRSVLFQQQINDRLPALLPDSARVAHKTGEIAGVRNDVGIVYTPEATWAIAVFSRDADEGEATAVIARLSKRVYEIFVGPILPPTATPRPTAPPTATPRPTPTESVGLRDTLE